MLSRPNRLKREEIGSIIKSGRRLSSGFYRATALKLSNTTVPRFAFVVSSKTAKRAVDRNLLKRRTRHIVRKNLKQLPGGWGVVVFIGPQVIKTAFIELEKDLLGLLIKL